MVDMREWDDENKGGKRKIKCVESLRAVEVKLRNVDRLYRCLFLPGSVERLTQQSFHTPSREALNV